jgi:hypothetical protein
MNQLTGIIGTTVAGVVGMTLLAGVPTQAQGQTCVPLQVVDGRGTQVEKSVSPPGTGVTRDNWNTDFVVPDGSQFNRYVAQISPNDAGEYRLFMALKYNNDTSDTVYDRVQQLSETNLYTIQGRPRNRPGPYQVNVAVGGLRAIGKNYTVSVLGCS